MRLKLTEANINRTCEEAEQFLRGRNTVSKDRIRTTLSLEETLLKYKNKFGSDADYVADFGGGLGRNRIRLSVPGEALDPFAADDSDEERFMYGMLVRMGKLPKWKYRHGVNTVEFTLE